MPSELWPPYSGLHAASFMQLLQACILSLSQVACLRTLSLAYRFWAALGPRNDSTVLQRVHSVLLLIRTLFAFGCGCASSLVLSQATGAEPLQRRPEPPQRHELPSVAVSPGSPRGVPQQAPPLPYRTLRRTIREPSAHPGKLRPYLGLQAPHSWRSTHLEGGVWRLSFSYGQSGKGLPVMQALFLCQCRHPSHAKLCFRQ